MICTLCQVYLQRLNLGGRDGWDSSVGIATGWTAHIQLLKVQDFSLHHSI
jgi:hypothetical protein